jgi:hypothetical protein
MEDPAPPPPSLLSKIGMVVVALLGAYMVLVGGAFTIMGIALSAKEGEYLSCLLLVAMWLVVAVLEFFHVRKTWRAWTE